VDDIRGSARAAKSANERDRLEDRIWQSSAPFQDVERGEAHYLVRRRLAKRQLAAAERRARNVRDRMSARGELARDPVDDHFDTADVRERVVRDEDDLQSGKV